LYKLTIQSLILFSFIISVEISAQITIDTIGTTEYVAQSLGPTGNRIVLDNLGGVHFTWTKAHPNPTNRDVYFNCITTTGCPFPGVGQAVSFVNGAGYGQIALTSDNKAAIAYHFASPGSESLYVAKDAFNCLGMFEYYRPGCRFGGNAHIWPSVAIDRSDRIHIVASELSTPGQLLTMIYENSSNGGASWTSPQAVDITSGGAVVVSSKVSNKTAIVYARADTISNLRNDIYYVISQDGLTWDFVNGRVNLTNYPNDDSIYACNDYDAGFDYNDNFYIVWVGRRFSSGHYLGTTHLFYYSGFDGTIGSITEQDIPDTNYCHFPIGYNAIAMVSLAASPDGPLFISYIRFDTSDCSLSGTANGEIFVQYSLDGGQHGSEPINISNTQSPGCQPPNCLSELWPSMAEEADDFVHIVCVLDNGGESPVTYYKIPMEYLGVSDNANLLPRNASLFSYPNPFNASTTISFSLEKAGPVTLEIYDLPGRKVTTLIDKSLQPGEHKVIWDAADQKSGIYFCKLFASNIAHSRKMILLK